jgi:hypothetical protein
MKQNRYTFLIATTIAIAAFSCKKEAQLTSSVNDNKSVLLTATNGENSSPTARPSSSGQCNPNAYNIVLESRTLVNGNWEWVWSVQNSNPGSGNNGTFQDLSNWGMQFGTCVNPSAMVSAAHSGDGTTWTGFTPSFQIDPSQSCMTTPVLKFDFGTIGSSKSYYKLVVNQNYTEASVPGYYKSGSTTGCCTFNFIGVGCPSGQEEE